MDAEALDLPTGSVDAVTCGFGVMFFPHLATALAEFRRVLKPGGRVAISTWAEPDPNYAWEYEMWRAYGIWERHPMAQMAQQLSAPAELVAVLEAAGFREIQVMAEIDFLQHADPAAWWERTLALGSGRASLESLGPERAAQFKHEALARLAALAGATGLTQRVTANFGLARNP
jgi:SAM-dependent methyltransferase